MRALALLLFLTTPAIAADKALILTDQEQQELIQVLDQATKMGGLSIAPVTAKLLGKLQSAPAVKEHPAGSPSIIPPQGGNQP
jgi:hypothetical protein